MANRSARSPFVAEDVEKALARLTQIKDLWGKTALPCALHPAQIADKMEEIWTSPLPKLGYGKPIRETRAATSSLHRSLPLFRRLYRAEEGHGERN